MLPPGESTAEAEIRQYGFLCATIGPQALHLGDQGIASHPV
jgi:hypothetical protein